MKRRQRASDEIMLIPFLDILCSLIGVLVLIIVVLCVAQLQKINGRDPKDIERAQDAQNLKKQKIENERINAQLKDKLPVLEELQKQAEQQSTQVANLRKLRDTSTTDRKKQEDLNQNLLKQVDDLMVELNGLNPQEKPLKQQIAQLTAEIEKRKPPANKGAAVIVQPGGSGLAKGAKVFFVEASGGKLTYYWNDKQKNVVSASPDTVAVDVGFNTFLKEVKDTPQGKIIFLLRDDGMGSYNLGAGWAQAQYQYGVDKLGKLPLPGRGEVDFKMFKEFMGSLTPPPPETLTPPPAAPGAAKPGAPGMTPPATPAPSAKPAAAATPVPAK